MNRKATNIGFVLTFFFSSLVGVAHGQVRTYECDVVPADDGWELVQNFCEAVEFVDNGKLIQVSDWCPGFDPPESKQIDYRYYLDDFIGEDQLFFEWRVETTGPREEMIYSSPAVFVPFNGAGVSYKFTISKDQIRVLRDVSLPVILHDIEPSVPHTYHIRLNGAQEYAWYVDGVLVDSGVPEKAFATVEPRVNIRAKAELEESVTTWDYIRWGVIPVAGSGDFNSDGVVNSFEVFYFDECLDRAAAGEPAFPGCAWADMNQDNTVNCIDAALFADVFVGDPSEVAFEVCNPVPAMSEWGLAVFLGAVLVGGSLAFRRSKACRHTVVKDTDIGSRCVQRDHDLTRCSSAAGSE